MTLRTANVEGLQEGALEIKGSCDLVKPSTASVGPERNDTNEEMVLE